MVITRFSGCTDSLTHENQSTHSEQSKHAHVNNMSRICIHRLIAWTKAPHISCKVNIPTVAHRIFFIRRTLTGTRNSSEATVWPYWLGQTISTFCSQKTQVPPITSLSEIKSRCCEQYQCKIKLNCVLLDYKACTSPSTLGNKAQT